MKLTPRNPLNFTCALVLTAFGCLYSTGVLAQIGSTSASVEFNRDILPIFAGTCFACHGPNEGSRVTNLRLDARDFLERLVIPGNAEGSVLFQGYGGPELGGGFKKRKWKDHARRGEGGCYNYDWR